jgi:type II secretory pathway component PulF
LDPAGKRRNGYIEAVDEKAAVAQIAAEGRFVVEISVDAGRSNVGKAAHTEEKKHTKFVKQDLALFSRRLSDLTGAGLPLDRVLQVLVEQTESEPLSKALDAALVDVRGGIPVSDALAKFPKIFPSVYTQTLAAGEASGQFSEAAERLAELQENEVARRSQVIGALVYPAVLTVVAVFVVVFLLAFVVPRLSGVFADMGDDLPAPTKVLLGVSGFITSNWLVILGVIVGSVVFYRIYSRTASGMMARDAFILRAPVIGSIAKKSIVSRYARILATLVHGGVPILEALRLSGLAAGNRVFLISSEQVEMDVRDGRPVAQAMRDTGVFPPVLTHMVAIGEETGNLPKMLIRVADSLDFETEQGLRRLTSLVEPIIVLAMGGIVAFVVLSVLLPIFQAQDLVK